MRAYERLLKYVQFDTASSEASDTCPSTPGQLVLAEALAAEMREMGLSEVRVDGNGYVYAALPANAELFGRFAKLSGNDIHMGIRPQNAHYHFEPTPGAIKGTVYAFETIGNKSVLTAQIGDEHLRMIAPNGLPVKLDQDVYVTFDIDRAIFFDAGSTEYIGRFDEAAIRELAASQAKEA